MAIITSLNEDEIDIFKKQYLSAPDLKKEIEALEKEKVSKTKKKAYKLWKDQINLFIDLYNLKTGGNYKKVI